MCGRALSWTVEREIFQNVAHTVESVTNNTRAVVCGWSRNVSVLRWRSMSECSIHVREGGCSESVMSRWSVAGWIERTWSGEIASTGSGVCV